ncbi:hypothetical protein ELH84_32520 [Rhizobium ruizarguesonis]|nr:hypothetical protein ELH84_32520 [Rhizobium ruizarguesonis]
MPSTADIDGLAWHFLGVLQAVMNLPQAGASGRVLRRVIDLGMSARPLKYQMRGMHGSELRDRS